MKPRTESDPFVGLNLRAFISAEDPYEMAVVATLVFWNWWRGNNEGLGAEGLAALGKMGLAKAKSTASKLEKRGWIEKNRKFGGKTQYRLTVEKMTFKEAYSIAANWLPQSQLDDSQLATTEPPISSDKAANWLPQSQPNIKRSDKSKTKSKTDAHEYTEDFEQAWAMYDKGSKFEAFGNWQKLGPSGPDADLFLKILEAIEWQSKTESWHEDGGKFRKDFCRWLKFKGWEISKPKDFKPAIIPGQRKTIDGVQL